MNFNNYKPVRLIELFAGIGSQAKALKSLGIDFEHYRVCEFDEHAIRSYNAIHDTNFVKSDITTLTVDDLGIINTERYTYLLTYSFPCQDLSNAGLGKGMKKGSGTRSGLLWEVERLLNECIELPQVLLMENVPQVHGSKNIEHFNQWIAFLESKGYSNYWKDLNAKDYDMPQNRNRCYMVSILGDYVYEFPKRVPATLKFGDVLETHPDDIYYLRPDTMTRLLNVPKDKHGPSLLNRSDEYAKTITTAIGRLGNFEQYIVERDGESSVLRKFTPRECWRLMGFTDLDFDKAKRVCTDSQLYKQAGNSIVVNVLTAIFKELFIPKKTRSEWLDALLRS